MQWEAECLRNVGSCVYAWREDTDPDFPSPALQASGVSEQGVHLCRVNDSHNHVQQLPTPQGFVWKLESEKEQDCEPNP